jgi:hypothetical protein
MSRQPPSERGSFGRERKLPRRCAHLNSLIALLDLTTRGNRSPPKACTALTDVFEQHLAGTRRTPHACRGVWRLEVVLSFLGIWRQASNVAALIRTRGSAEYSVAALFLAGILGRLACLSPKQFSSENHGPNGFRLYHGQFPVNHTGGSLTNGW